MISIFITLLLVLLVWLLLDWMVQMSGTNAWGSTVLVVLAAALSLAVERSLSSLPLPITSRYRIAFFTSVAWPITQPFPAATLPRM